MAGMTDEEAIVEANLRCGIRGKDFARTRIRGAGKPITLSVAVEGGSAGLNRRGAEKGAKLSMHGRWPHVHLGALEAAYGRMPYYQYIIPALCSALVEVREWDKLGEFNHRIHCVLSGFLQTCEVADKGWDGVVVRRGSEIAAGLDENLSLIDALMRHGPETSLALLCYNSEQI